jgi:hypothetical protein
MKPEKSEEQWQKLAPRFRKTSAHPTSAEAPLGFATKKPPLFNRFRNCSLATAGATTLALIVLLNLQEPQTQFLPVPEFDLPTPTQP